METVKFPIAEEPKTLLLTKERTRRPVNIVLQGKWDVHFKAPSRMYLVRISNRLNISLEVILFLGFIMSTNICSLTLLYTTFIL